MELRFVADKLEALVAETLAAGGRFQIQDDRVRVSAPAPLPGELLARLRVHKPDLIAWLRSRPVCCECRQPITEPVVAWWGGKPAHAGCGERAWQKAWAAVPTERRGGDDEGRAA
jgi:hypothetical protein